MNVEESMKRTSLAGERKQVSEAWKNKRQRGRSLVLLGGRENEENLFRAQNSVHESVQDNLDVHISLPETSRRQSAV